MPWRLEFKASAKKELQQLDRKAQERVAAAIRDLIEAPRPVGVKALRGVSGHFRIRVGDYRVVYELLEGALIIVIVRVAHRREVYR